jgi:hypothetical protein
MLVKITKRQIDALSPGDLIVDDEVRGFVARKLPSGVVTYGFRYRDKKTNRRRWLGLGLHGSVTAEQARNLAKKRDGEVADARDPVAELGLARAEAARAELAATNTVNLVLDNFLREYVRGSDALRSGDQVEGAFKRHVRPRIGEKSIYELQRSDIKTMLTEIAREHGPVMAERVLGHVIGGVRETYDRYEYLDEKRDALTKLASLLREILSRAATQQAGKHPLADLVAA